MGAGDAVGLWLPRGVEMYVAMLGIMEAGAHYVPMDPESPPERATFVAQDCAARVLVTTPVLAKAVGASLACPVVCFETEQSRIDAEPAKPLRAAEIGVTPDHPAYVIYTSGTTGRPKGVVCLLYTSRCV